MSLAGVQALTFDVFGTVVDWRGSIIREGDALGAAHGLEADWAAFADAWRGGYRPSMARVRSGELPWTKLDALHRMILDELLEKHGISTLSEADKQHWNRVWHRLTPWPDSVPGLTRLRQHYVLATLSNGNVALLTNMAKHGGLPWDCILSAEIVRYYAGPRDLPRRRRVAGAATLGGDDGGGAQVGSEGGAGRRPARRLRDAPARIRPRRRGGRRAGSGFRRSCS